MGKLLPQGRGHVLPGQWVVETLDIALQFHLPNTTTNRLLQATTAQKTSAMEGGERERERPTVLRQILQCSSIQTTAETMEPCFRFDSALMITEELIL